MCRIFCAIHAVLNPQKHLASITHDLSAAQSAIQMSNISIKILNTFPVESHKCTTFVLTLSHTCESVKPHVSISFLVG